MLDAVLVGALYAVDLVKLCLGEFACCDGWRGKVSILCSGYLRTDVFESKKRHTPFGPYFVKSSRGETW